MNHFDTSANFSFSLVKGNCLTYNLQGCHYKDRIILASIKFWDHLITSEGSLVHQIYNATKIGFQEQHANISASPKLTFFQSVYKMIEHAAYVDAL